MTSVRQILDPLPAATREAQGLHCLLHSLDDGSSIQDEPGDDNMVVSHSIVDRFLRCVEGEAVNAIPQVFDVCEARNEGIRHYGRLGQIHAHYAGSPSLFFSPLRERSKHNVGGQSNHKSPDVLKYYASVSNSPEASSDGEKFPNSNPTDRALLVAADGQPSTPSPKADGAKNGRGANSAVGRGRWASIVRINFGRAVTNSQSRISV